MGDRLGTPGAVDFILKHYLFRSNSEACSKRIAKVMHTTRSANYTTSHAAGRPCGPMDKASDYESGDSRFESWQGRQILEKEINSMTR